MADLSKPIPTDPELLALIEKAKLIKITPEMHRAQKRSWVIGQMLLSNPEMTREYVVGVLDGIEQTYGVPPHVMAETIAAAIEPKGRGAKARREALEWAAGVARSLYPAPREATDGAEQ